MNLAKTIVFQLFAGGPGSGCHGPNCGRPATGKKDVADINKEIRQLRQKLQRGSGTSTKERARIKQVIQVYQNHLRQLGRPAPEEPQPIQVAPAKKSQVVQKFTFGNGTTYTMVAPNKRGRPQGSGNKAKDYSKILNRQHTQKDKFSSTHEDVKPEGQNARVSVYDASKSKEGSGTTVIVNRDLGGKRMVIQEFARGQFGHLESMQQFKFKNLGKGAGVLNKRYGIRQKLPKR